MIRLDRNLLRRMIHPLTVYLKQTENAIVAAWPQAATSCEEDTALRLRKCTLRHCPRFVRSTK